MNSTYPALGSEFNEFLYAPIAEDHDGGLLSVLSALARSNLDPWDEAARLARLPHDAASQFLTTLIAGIPGPAARKDPAALVERLIGLLPMPVAVRAHSPQAAATQVSTRHHTGGAAWILFIVVLLFLLVNQWLAGVFTPASAPTGAVAPATPAAASSQAPAAPAAR
jgi:hypothetical protein